MKWISTILILCFTHEIGLALPKSHWKLSSKNKTSELWQWKMNREIICSLQISRSKNILNNQKVLKKKADKIDRHRKSALRLIGIRNWNKKQGKWRKLKLGNEYRLTGNYRNHKNNLINFQEIHIFGKKKYVQALFTSPVLEDYSKIRQCFQYARSAH